MAVIKIVPMPGVGVPGPQGQAGQDGEGFNFRGAWQTNTLYLKNDVVTQGGSSYIANYDYQDTSGPSLDGDLWAVLAQKGEDGSGGNADTADFVFEVLPVADWTESFMTVANHDMNIRTTTVTPGDDGDIEINSADDLRLIAYDNLDITSGGPIDITSDVDVSIILNNEDGSQTWDFRTTGTLETPGSIEVDSNALISAVNETRSESEAVSQVFTDSSLMIDNADGSAIFIPLDTTAQTIAGYQYQQGSISVTLNDSTVIQLDYINQGTASGGASALFFAFTDNISKPLTDIFPFTFNGTRIITNEVNTLTLAPYDTNGEPLPIEWQFGSDGTLTTPAGNVTIVNPASPGDITLSAYNGVKLSFADVEGAGLKFPDNTVQTTAYIGGDTASHGDFYFDQSTLKIDSSSDMILEANEGDGSVAAQIKVGKGYIPIDIIAYERRDVTFGTGEWSTAEWQSDGGNGGQVVLTGITNIYDFLSTSFNGDFQKIIINNDTMYPYSGASYGNGNATIYITTGPDGGIPVAVTSLGFSWAEKSGITIDHDDAQMDINAPNMDLNLNAGDGLDLSSGQNIRFYANSGSLSNFDWTMSSNGNFELPGSGYISNPVNSSGDGNGYSTIKIVPDTNREQYDQYLIVDPTQPNHIHIRAGGTQDASNAELILGAEENHVAVNDSADSVTIKTKRDDSVWTYQNVNSGGTTFIVNLENSEPDYGDFLIDNDIKYTINYVFRNLETYSTEYTAAAPDGTLLEFAPWTFYTFFRDNGSSYWQFNNQGYLSGPAMGYVNVYGIQNPSTSDNLLVYSNDKVLIAGTNGEFLNDSSVPSNQIATIGDLPTGATGSFVSQDGKTIIVTNGIITGII